MNIILKVDIENEGNVTCNLIILSSQQKIYPNWLLNHFLIMLLLIFMFVSNF